MSHTKKETDFWGNEKEVHYDDDGNKAGETRYRETFFGNKVQDHYDAEGTKTGETRRHEGLFSDKAVHFDSDGKPVGYTKDDETFFGDKIQRHYNNDDDVVGKSRYEETFFGNRKKVHEGEYFKGRASNEDSQSSSSGSGEESFGSVVGVIIIIGILWWLGSQTDSEKSGSTANVPTHKQSEALYVNALQLNLRSGPGQSYDLITILEANDIVTPFETSRSNDGGIWVKVHVNSNEGWVNQKFLSIQKFNGIPLNKPIASFGTREVEISNTIELPDIGSNWESINVGQSVGSLKLNGEGSLLIGNSVIVSSIVASYTDGKPITAKKILVSPASPNKQFVFLKACDGTTQESLCWSLYLLDVRKKVLLSPYAGKYGPDEWVEWSKDNLYAFLRYESHGEFHLYRVDLGTGESVRVQ